MDLKKIYQEIAKQNGVTVEEAKREMQAAIDAAYNSPNNNDMTRAYQDKVPRKGEVPTVDEFILYMAERAKKNKRK